VLPLSLLSLLTFYDQRNMFMSTKLTVILLGSVFLSAPVFSSTSRASAGGGAAHEIHAIDAAPSFH